MIYKFFSFLILSLLSSCTGRTLHANLQTIEVNESETITGLRVVQRENQPYLLIARKTNLFEASIPEKIKGPLVFKGAGSLDSATQWDAKPIPEQTDILGSPAPKHTYASLSLYAGSAVSWVMSKGFFKDAHRLHFDTFANYGHPRFVKGQSVDDPWLKTAIHYKDGSYIPVLFGLSPSGASPQYTGPFELSLGEYSEGIIDARLTKVGDNFWLFMLMEDALLDDRVRQLPSGKQRGGTLSVVQFDKQFKPLTEKTHLFYQAPIYEFDIDVTADNKIFLFAVTNEATLFSHTQLIPNQPIAKTDLVITKLEAPLESPSITVVGDYAHMAALGNSGLAEASVFYKKYPVKK